MRFQVEGGKLQRYAVTTSAAPATTSQRRPASRTGPGLFLLNSVNSVAAASAAAYQGRFHPFRDPGRCAHFTVRRKLSQATPSATTSATRGVNASVARRIPEPDGGRLDLLRQLLLVLVELSRDGRVGDAENLRGEHAGGGRARLANLDRRDGRARR